MCLLVNHLRMVVMVMMILMMMVKGKTILIVYLTQYSKSIPRSQKLQQLQHNQRLKSLPPTISHNPAATMKEEDDTSTPPTTPYGTPHVTSLLYGAHLANLSEQLDQL